MTMTPAKWLWGLVLIGSSLMAGIMAGIAFVHEEFAKCSCLLLVSLSLKWSAREMGAGKCNYRNQETINIPASEARKKPCTDPNRLIPANCATYDCQHWINATGHWESYDGSPACYVRHTGPCGRCGRAV